jgi:hypothetical protein
MLCKKTVTLIKRSVVSVVCLENGTFCSSQKEFDCTGTECSRRAKAKVYLVVEDLSAKALPSVDLAGKQHKRTATGTTTHEEEIDD